MCFAGTRGVSTSKRSVWDTGRISAAANTLVLYNGSALRSDTKYLWSIQCWIGQTQGSGTSSFRTGLLDAKQWLAQWITPGPHATLLRSEFVAPAHMQVSLNFCSSARLPCSILAPSRLYFFAQSHAAVCAVSDTLLSHAMMHAAS